MPTQRRQEGPPRRRPRLSRRRIFEAALTLVDREGPSALTMRRLAQELGVAAMSIYNHVHGQRDLLDGLVSVMVEQIGVRPGDGTPRERLRRFAEGIRAVAKAHPGAFELVGMRPLHMSAALLPVEAALGALREVGLREAESVHAYRALVSYARGFALAELAGFTLEARTRAPDDHAVLDADLPAEMLPEVAELAPWLRGASHDEAFAFGLRALLAGIEAEISASSGAPPGRPAGGGEGSRRER